MDNKPKDQSEEVNPELGTENVDAPSSTPEVPDTTPVSEEVKDPMDAFDNPSTTPPPPAFPSEQQPAPPSGSDTPPPTDTSPPSASVPADDGGKKNIGLMIGALLALMFVFLVLIYYFVLRQSPEPEQPNQQVPLENIVPSPTEVITPTPELTEEAVESIDIGSPEADLTPITTDLENL